MGSGEAPPAAADIKIYISGNSGSKEVSMVFEYRYWDWKTGKITNAKDELYLKKKNYCFYIVDFLFNHKYIEGLNT